MFRGVLAASALGLVAAACRTGPGPDAPGRLAKVKKRILILGGTGFLGPKTIDAAIARGHTVTIFNRGKREKYLPLKVAVEHLYGNRDPLLPADDERDADGKLLHPAASPKGLEQLVGREWDAVIDNSGYVPRMVGASAQLLAGHVQQYIYISSISAYDDNTRIDGDEHTRLATLADPTVKALLAWYPTELERRTKVKRELEDEARAKGAPVPSIPDPAALRAGPPAEREAELLAAWKASPAP